MCRPGMLEFQFVLGLPFLGLALLAMAYILPGNIALHYGALCAGALLGAWTWRKRLGFPSAALGLRALTLVFSFAGISILYFYSLALYTLGPETVRFTAYFDLFLHANTLSIFATNPEAFGNRYLLGADNPFYHYASYLIPAAFRRFSGASNLTAVVGIGSPWAT